MKGTFHGNGTHTHPKLLNLTKSWLVILCDLSFYENSLSSSRFNRHQISLYLFKDPFCWLVKRFVIVMLMLLLHVTLRTATPPLVVRVFEEAIARS